MTPALFPRQTVCIAVANFSRHPYGCLISVRPDVPGRTATTQEGTMRRVLAAAAALAIALSAAPSFAQEKLTVWWVKGFYKSEDDALYAAIKKFEAKTGVKVELSQYAVQDMNAKSVAALDAGTVPDIAYSDTYDVQTAGKWAFDGKLDDISDVIGPMKGRFSPNTVETTFLYSDKAKKKAYYAFPIKQQTLHIQYWKDMLGQAGFKENDIPGTWNEYWSFWCDKVQPAIRKATGQRVYGIGSPMGVESTDSFQSFLSWDDANNVQLTAEQRAAGRKAYDELIATSGFPKKPDGSPMVYRAAVKVGVIFQDSKNKKRAREFLTFLLEEDNLRPYVEGALGRWFPVTKESQKSPFWQADRHRKAVYDQFMAGTVPFEFTKNYKFTILNNENVWAKAMNRILSEKVPVDKAVDEMIARIKQVAG